MKSGNCSAPEPPTVTSFAAERRLVAQACRILAAEGLAETVLGHVSLRVGRTTMLVRARRAGERGLLSTTTEDIALVDLDGNLAPGEGALALPIELPIHGELLRARPELQAVVHAHPPEVVVCTVTCAELRPFVGAYSPTALWLVRRGIPTYDYAGLVRNRVRAEAMVAAMGDAGACLLRGHGLTTAGRSVQEAVLRAIDVHTLARLTVAAAPLGGATALITDDDLADLPEPKGAYLDQLWRHYCAKADHRGA